MTEKEKVINLILEYIDDCEYKSDKDSIRTLLTYVQYDNLVEAYKHFDHLDTYIREGIPEDVHNYIWLNRNGIGKTKTINLTLRKKSDNVVLYKGEMQFPDDATEFEIGRNLMNAEAKLLKDLLEFVYV